MIEFPEETRKSLLALVKTNSFYIDGNLLKILQDSGDEEFRNYLNLAKERDKNIRVKRLDLTKQIQTQNKDLDSLNKKLMTSLTQLEVAKNNALDSLKKVERQNEGVVQFSWMVSHNLRGPVASLLGIVNILSAQGIVSPENAPLVEHLKSSALKIDHMIKEISQALEVNILPNEPEASVEVAAVIQQIFSEQANNLDVVDAALRIQFDEQLKVWIVPSAFNQILTNLIENALIFRDHERPLQYVIDYSSDGYYHRFVFRDNGIGIDPAVVEKVFDPFKVLSTQSRGKGMGLYVVRSKLEALNGTIKVDSTPGKGSEFTVEIPLRNNEEADVKVRVNQTTQEK